MRFLLSLILLGVVTCSLAARQPLPPDKEAQAQLDRYFRHLTKEIADRALADVKTLEDWTTQRDQRRRELAEMLGLWPTPEKTDLQATVTGTVDAGEFVVEKLHFQSRPKLYVTANFYRPKVVDKPLPTILYACGHGNVKIDGVSYGAKANYQHHSAWFARNGYCCLILDTLQLGEIEGEHHGTYRNNKWWWISRGYTPAGVEAWNCIRALDYLETRPEVDKAKIGMTGRSGGGAYTWWTAALDDRIACLVPVAGITDLENHVVDGCIEGHCDCMYMVNTYQWDFATVAALAAPRPLLIANTDKDNIFPLNGVYRIHQKVKRIYDLHKAGDKLGLLITEGGHNDTQELQVPTFQWFNRFLKNDKVPITKLAEKLLDPKQLKVFENLPEDQRNTTVDEWFVPAAAIPPAPKTLAEWEKMREGYLKDLKEKVFRNWPKEPPPLDVKVVAENVLEGMRLTTLEYQSESDTKATVLVLAPEKGLKDHPIVTIHPLDDEDWNTSVTAVLKPFNSNQEINPVIRERGIEELRHLATKLVESNHAFVFCVPRAVGKLNLTSSGRLETHIRRRFVLLGRTLEEARTWDLHRGVHAALTWLRSEPRTMVVNGNDRAGVMGLCLAAINPKFKYVVFGYPPTEGPNSVSLINLDRLIGLIPLGATLSPRQLTVHRHGNHDWGFAHDIFSMGEGVDCFFLGHPPHDVGTIEIFTDAGTIEVELDFKRAPRTTYNFDRYVAERLFEGGSFHRTVTKDNQADNPTKIAVIQAGIATELKQLERKAIQLERTKDTGLKHLDGTLSMARDGPDTATSDFFICIGDQPELDYGGKRNPDGQGFAAFGRVIKGMDVVRKIHQAPADGQKLTPPVKIISIKRKN